MERKGEARKTYEAPMESMVPEKKGYPPPIQTRESTEERDGVMCK